MKFNGLTSSDYASGSCFQTVVVKVTSQAKMEEKSNLFKIKIFGLEST
jgi:hypothetical protein